MKVVNYFPWIHYILEKLYYLIKKIFRKERWLIEKINFINNTTPALNATNLNKLQDNVEDLIKTVKTNSDEETYCCNYINEIVTYSTNEKVIGTWIDGRPIYRKTMYIDGFPSTNNTSGSDTSINTGITNMDIPINLYGIYYDKTHTEGSYPIMHNIYYDTPTGFISTRISNDGTRITTRTFESRFGNYAGYITVEYVKTTD